MTSSFRLLPALVLATVAVVALPVAPVHAVVEACASSQAANATFLTSYAAATATAAQKSAMLQAFLAGNPGKAACLISQAKVSHPTLAKALFKSVVTILSTNPQNETLVTQLGNDNPDLALTDTTNTEPGAGPDGTNPQDFGTPVGGNPENAGQLNDQTGSNPNSPSSL